MRAAQLTDEPALARFFTHVKKENLRFRFLNALITVGHHLLTTLTNADHDRTENILAFDVDGKNHNRGSDALRNDIELVRLER